MKNSTIFRLACVTLFVLHVIISLIHLHSGGYSNNITVPQRIYLKEKIKPMGIPAPFLIAETKQQIDTIKINFKVNHTYGGKKFNIVDLSEEGKATVKIINDSLESSIKRTVGGKFNFFYGRSDLSEEALKEAGFKSIASRIKFTGLTVLSTSSAEGKDSSSLKVDIIDTANVELATNRANFVKRVVLNSFSNNGVDTTKIIKLITGSEAQLSPMMADYYSTPQGFEEVKSFNANGQPYISELQSQRQSDVTLKGILPVSETKSITQPFWLLWLALLSLIFSKISWPRFGNNPKSTELERLTPERITPSKEKYDWSCLLLHIGSVILIITSTYAWINGDLWPAIGLTIISIVLILRTGFLCYGWEFKFEQAQSKNPGKTTYQWFWKKLNFSWLTPCLILHFFLGAAGMWIIQTLSWLSGTVFITLFLLTAWLCWGWFTKTIEHTEEHGEAELDYCMWLKAVGISALVAGVIFLYLEIIWLGWTCIAIAIVFLVLILRECYSFKKVPTCKEFWAARGKTCPCIIISRWFRNLTCCQIMGWIALASLVLNVYQYFSK